MSLYAAIGHNTPFGKYGAKVMKKVKQIQNASIFFDLFALFA